MADKPEAAKNPNPKVLVLKDARNYGAPYLKGVFLERFDIVDPDGNVTRRDGSNVGAILKDVLERLEGTGFFAKMPLADAAGFVARRGLPKPGQPAK